MTNPHKGSDLKTAFSPDEWKEVEKDARKKAAPTKKRRAKKHRSK